MRTILLSIFFVVLTTFAFSQSVPYGLFEPVPEGQLEISSQFQGKIAQVRANKLNKKVTIVKIGTISSLQRGGAVPFTIPDKIGKAVALTSMVEYISPDHFTWEGKFIDREGNAIIMARDGEIFGHIRIEGIIYDLQYLENGYGLLVEYDNDMIQSHVCAVTQPEPGKSDEEPHTVQPLSGSTEVRVLVLFTNAAQNAVTNINSVATLSVQQLNSALMKSAITYNQLNFTLAGSQFLNFNESASIDADVENLHNNSTAQNLRNQFEADLVVLLTNGALYGGVVGIVEEIESSEDDAYAIVQVLHATSSLTFAHEVGHLMGGRHQQCSIYFNQGCDETLGDAHGYGFHTGIWPFRAERTTIMHQHRQNWDREAHFSNPDVQIANKATGVNGSNNNARVFRANAPIVADFRNFTPPISVNISGPPFGDNEGTYTWIADVSHGTPPYIYQWEASQDGFNYHEFGSTQSITAHLPYDNDLYLRLTVTDSNDNQDIAFHTTRNNDGEGCIKCISGFLEAASADSVLSALKGKIKLYPNPTIGKITAEFTLDEASKVNIQVTDFKGMVVKEMDLPKQKPGVQQQEIDLSSLREGLYLIRITDTNGSQVLRAYKN